MAKQELHVCQNCAKEWPLEVVDVPIKNFWERVSPGEICPSGECPDCGALTHPKEPVATAALRAALLQCRTEPGAFCFCNPTKENLTRRLDNINMVVEGAVQS